MALAKTAWLRLDDWGLAPRSEANRRDLLEIVEDRHGHRATLLTSPLPVEHWQEALGDPTLADAILERLVPNASKLTLQGESMRQRQAKLPHGAGSDEQQPPSVAALHSPAAIWPSIRGAWLSLFLVPLAAAPPLLAQPSTVATPNDEVETCLGCHEKSAQANWSGSVHDRRNLACTSCHSIHDYKSDHAQLKTTRDSENCFTCHPAMRAKSLRTSHHPLREGKMECASCHNPHDSTRPKMIKAEWTTELFGADVKGRYAELKRAAADRCPRSLGTIVKAQEVQFHHEVYNQFLWNMF